MLEETKLEIYQLIEQLPAGQLFKAKELLEGLLEDNTSAIPSTPAENAGNDSLKTFVKEAILDLNEGEIGFREIDEDLGELTPEEWPKYLYLLLSSEALQIKAKRLVLKGFANKALKSQKFEGLTKCLAIFDDLRVEAWQTAFEELKFIYQRQFDNQTPLVKMREELLSYAKEALAVESPALILTVSQVLHELSSPDNKLVFVMSRPFKDTQLRKQVIDALVSQLPALSIAQWQQAFQLLAQYPSPETTQALYQSLKLDQQLPPLIQKNLLTYFRAHGTDEMFVKMTKEILDTFKLSDEFRHFLLILIKSATITEPTLLQKLRECVLQLSTTASPSHQELIQELLQEKLNG